MKEGRWEVIGGMWVEPDLNMPDGESLVRQILYGKRYFKPKFGVDINIGWNPDSFGYNWQLPQIYKRSGIDYFVTQKLLVGARVHHVSLSPVLVAVARRQPNADLLPQRLRQCDRSGEDGARLVRLRPDDVEIQRRYGFRARRARCDMMYLYGVGDHGGGPTRVDLDTALRWQKVRRGVSADPVLNRDRVFSPT